MLSSSQSSTHISAMRLNWGKVATFSHFHLYRRETSIITRQRSSASTILSETSSWPETTTLTWQWISWWCSTYATMQPALWLASPRPKSTSSLNLSTWLAFGIQSNWCRTSSMMNEFWRPRRHTGSHSTMFRVRITSYKCSESTCSFMTIHITLLD